jgi:iron complex outermembrane receptor protein
MLAPAGSAIAAPPPDPSEILVTAERRPVPLSRLPLSISALGAEALDRAAVRSARDLAGRLPNLGVQPGISNGTGAIFTLRGIATSADETFGFDNPVGLYLDGVPLARSTAAVIDLIDIDRVEVVRGPQGTLFGRNTIGGAISLVPRSPPRDAGWAMRAEAGSRRFHLLRGRLDSGAIGPVRLSLTGQYSGRNGYVTNRLATQGADNPGGGHVGGVRLAASIDMPSGWQIDLSADWLESRAVPPASQFAIAGDGQSRPPLLADGDLFQPVQPAPVGRWLATVDAVPGCSLSPVTVRQSELCLQDATQVRDTLWGGLARLKGDVGTARLTVTVALRGWSNRAEAADIDGLPFVSGPLLSASSLLNGIPAVTLQLIPGIDAATAEALAASPVPRGPARLFGSANVRRVQQWTGELELASPDDAPVVWTTGLFALHEVGSDRNEQQFGSVIDVVETILVPRFGELAPTLAADLPIGTRDRFQPLPDRLLAYRIANWSLAAYAQLSVQLGYGLGLTAGLRLTHDRRTMARSQNGIVPFDAVERAANDVSVSFTEPTGNLTLDWTDEAGLRTWLRLARGYQSGGFNARQATRPAAAGQSELPLLPFAPETLWSAELGARFVRRGLSLSMALFSNWNRDKLINIVIPDAPTLGTVTVNAGRARFAGLELEAAIPLGAGLRLDAGFGHTWARIDRFPFATTDGRQGNAAPLVQLPNLPATTASIALDGQWQIGRQSLALRAGWVHVGPQRFFGSLLSAPFADRLRATASNRFDIDLRVSDLDLGAGRATVALWAQGLGKPAAVRAVDLGQLGFGTLLYAEPARIGLTLTIEH